MANEQHQPTSPAQAATSPSQPAASPRRRRARRGRVLLALGALLLVALGIVWAMRKEIADDVIAGQLESLGLPARYEIVSIGPSQQVIRDLVIGDPARPDLVVAELRVATRLRWGLPGIGRITVIRPRLYGTYRGGKLSFGSLDKALFAGDGGPFEMPDLDVAVVDGRALIVSQHGRVGVKLDGEGPLRGGFSGTLAAIAPRLSSLPAGCQAGRTTLYGTVSIEGQRPRFQGPLRTRELACPDQSLAKAEAQLDVTLDRAMDGAEGKLGLKAAGGRQAEVRVGARAGTASFAYRKNALNARYDLTLRGIAAPQARFASLEAEGRVRAADGFARFDVESDIEGRGIALGDAAGKALRDAELSGEGTLLAPIARQVRSALARETRASTLTAGRLRSHR